MAVKAPVKAPAPSAPLWGSPGVSEIFRVQDTAIALQPNQQTQLLAPVGILTELRVHANLSDTLTHGTGTNALDVYGPYDAIQRLDMITSPQLSLIGGSGHMLGVLQRAEYPLHTWEASADPATVMNPLTNASDMFNFVLTAGSAQIFRFWLHLPIAIRLVGYPGGVVGPVVLQNRKVANSIKLTSAATGTASPWTFASSAGFGAAPYNITGNDTVTATGNFELWKLLNTVPVMEKSLPEMGLMRQISEALNPYSGSSFTYNFEPGGGLLRFFAQVEDATVKGGIATTNISQLTFQYGINKGTDIVTPFENIHSQLDLYGTVLGQGVYAFDYYTKTRSLRDVKSLENLANVQFVINFASTYTPPANSQVRILIDKIIAVGNTMSK